MLNQQSAAQHSFIYRASESHGVKMKELTTFILQIFVQTLKPPDLDYLLWTWTLVLDLFAGLLLCCITCIHPSPVFVSCRWSNLLSPAFPSQQHSGRGESWANRSTGLLSLKCWTCWTSVPPNWATEAEKPMRAYWLGGQNLWEAVLRPTNTNRFDQTSFLENLFSTGAHGATTDAGGTSWINI